MERPLSRMFFTIAAYSFEECNVAHGSRENHVC
jgi:hypothetical protein